MHMFLGTYPDPIRVFPLMRVRIRLFTLMLHRIRIRIRLFTLLRIRIRTWILLLIKWCEWLYFEPSQFLILKLIWYVSESGFCLWCESESSEFWLYADPDPLFNLMTGSATLWEPFTLPGYICASRKNLTFLCPFGDFDICIMWKPICFTYNYGCLEQVSKCFKLASKRSILSLSFVSRYKKSNLLHSCQGNLNLLCHNKRQTLPSMVKFWIGQEPDSTTKSFSGWGRPEGGATLSRKKMSRGMWTTVDCLAAYELDCVAELDRLSRGIG